MRYVPTPDEVVVNFWRALTSASVRYAKDALQFYFHTFRSPRINKITA